MARMVIFGRFAQGRKGDAGVSVLLINVGAGRRVGCEAMGEAV
jgi:hypothetical protein